MSSSLDLLLARLDLDADPARSQTWIGTAGAGSLNRSRRLFGGLIVAQATIAAARSQPDRRIHSIQQVFLRAGNVVDPLYYRVDPLFEGGVHATSLVSVEQSGEVISHAHVGFTRGRDDQPDFDEPVAAGSDPADDAVDRDRLRGNLADGQTSPIEMRVRPAQQNDRGPELDTWFRANGDAGNDSSTHLALLGYASDRGMLSAANKMLHGEDDVVSATINHSIWVHRPFSLADWHLHRVRVASLSDGRGLIDGAIYGVGGRRVVSTRQEGVVRVR